MKLMLIQQIIIIEIYLWYFINSNEYPIFFAAKYGSRDLIKMIIEAGADIDVFDQNDV